MLVLDWSYTRLVLYCYYAGTTLVPWCSVLHGYDARAALVLYWCATLVLHSGCTGSVLVLPRYSHHWHYSDLALVPQGNHTRHYTGTTLAIHWYYGSSMGAALAPLSRSATPLTYECTVGMMALQQLCITNALPAQR